MATYEELKKKYREKRPEAAGAPKEVITTSYEDLKTKYNERSSVKEAPSIITEEKEKPRELRWEEYKGPEIVDREEEPLWRKAAKWILPKKAEEFLGLAKPMPEKTIQQKMMDQETARQSYRRDQKFQKTLQDARQAGPEEFEMPEGYEEPKAFGQLIEGIEAGYRSTLLPSVGYFTESVGIKIGSPEMIKWGMETGDAAMVDFLKRPELLRPEDLKGFLDGGATDLRAYGRVIGETLPFMLTVISLSVAGGMMGGPGGALAGGWASAAAIEQGNAYKSYLDEGVAVDKAADASFIYGIIAGGIENMMGIKPAGIANKILNPTKIATTGFKSWLLKELPKMGLKAMRKSIEEGAEEVAQQIAEDLMGKWAGSEDGMATIKELGEQFMAGAVGSLPFGVSEFRAPSLEAIGITKPITPTDVKLEVEKKPEEIKPAPEIKKEMLFVKEGKTSVEQESTLPQNRTYYHGISGERLESLKRTGEIPRAEQAFGGEFSITDDFGLAEQHAGEKGKVIEVKLNKNIEVGESTMDEGLLHDVSDIGEGEYLVGGNYAIEIKPEVKPVLKKEIKAPEIKVRTVKDLDKAAVDLFIEREGKEAYESKEIGETLERIEQKAEAYDPVFLEKHPEIKGHDITVYHDPIAGKDWAVIDNTDNKIVEIFDVELEKAFAPEKKEPTQKVKVKEAVKEHIKPKVEEAVKKVKPAKVQPKVVEVIPKVKEKAVVPKDKIIAPVKFAVGKSTTLPILENFLVKKGKLTATDLEIGVRLNTDLKDGAYKIVGKEAVTTDVPVEDFPIVPKVEGKMVGQILSSNLTDVLKRANLSISKNQMRPELNSVLLEIKNNIMNVVSTDSFRLFRQTTLLKGENANVKLLIPAIKLQKILASIKEDSRVEIYDQTVKEGGMVHFRTKFGDITVRKIDGDFPVYQDIYPELNEKYVLDRKQFLATLKELKPFVDKRINDITLTYKDGKLDFFAENKEEKVSKKITLNTTQSKIKKVNSGSVNDGVALMEIKSEDAPKAGKFRFNVNYLIDTMNALKGDRVMMYSSTDVAVLAKLFSTVAEGELKSVAKPKGSANATIGKFREGEEVELGGMDKVRPIEFPELVELSRDLMGRVPEVSRRLRTALGKFYGMEKGRIKLKADIFKDEATASRVLAHEIGHLVDYLPHKTLKRGNLLGSLLSLRGFLNSTFGVEGALDLARFRNQARKEVLSEEKVSYKDITKEIKEKIKTRYNKLVTETGAMKDADIRKELQAVTKYWRPYEEAEASASYNNYRNSSRELYADAISLLFNSPGTLERLAPKFYKGFFDGLDAKPEVKNAYFDIQEVLSHDRATLIALRRKRTQEMFQRADYKSEELQKIKEKEREFRFKDYWHRFTYTIKSINQPIYDKVNQAEAEGKYIQDDQNPKYLLSAQNYISGQIKAEFEEKVQPVMEDLTKNDIDWQSFGEFLLYERVAEGDRSEFANPGGITRRDASERIATIKSQYGEAKFAALEKGADKFRVFLKDLSEQAYNEGMVTPEMYKLIKENPKYAPFQVVEYMDNYVSWKSKAQIGTLKDVNNPANSLILKAVSTIRAIENQKNRKATFKMLEDAFPDEIQDARMGWSGKAQIPLEPKEDGIGMVTYYVGGKLRGKYVDEYIAKSLEKDSIARNKAIMKVLSPVRYLNRKLFRPMFVIYNPGWIPFNFIRDYMRFWKNTPGLSFIGAAKRYGQAYRASKIRAFGMSKKESAQEIEARNLIRQLEKEKVLSVTWNDIMAGQDVEDAQIQGALEKIGLAEQKKEIPAMYKPAVTILEKFKILPLLRGIRKTGDLIETLSKVAGYLELEGKMKPEEMRNFIRKNVGSPDFFEKGWATPATNNVFLFSNAFIQAVTADANIATSPKTRSGFWWKTGKVILIPKILMFAALMGAFGDDLKELMSDASEYDMTNYFIVPIGKDSNNGKTIYLRIPMDETSRLIGALAWKIMRGTSNDQKIGRDIADIASLFGGQLPGWSPAISAPISALEFAAGKNPYDSFRGRLALTEEQMKAGGMYAIKPFLMWEFQQLGGNVFVKLYSGEQTPTEKSAGEKFLRLPVISNIVGRFVKISDYGQLEKYRAKMYEVKGEKARERIDENILINDYVKKYQKEEGDFNELSQDLIMDVLGHAISSREEKSRATNIRKKFKISIEKGKADPKINAMISAVSNDEKVTLMRVYKEIMSEKDFKVLRAELLKHKIISTNVLRELNKPFQP